MSRQVAHILSNIQINDSLLNLGCAMHKIVIPKLIARILDQLNEGDEKTPRMRPIHNQTFEQDTCYLLLRKRRREKIQLEKIHICMIIKNSRANVIEEIVLFDFN